jgi:hypothetical protein
MFQGRPKKESHACMAFGNATNPRCIQRIFANIGDDATVGEIYSRV